MLHMKYKDKNETYEVSFRTISNNVVELTGDFPVKADGFFLSRPDFDDNWDYSAYTTIYREIENGVQFSNDSSAYVEPEAPGQVQDPEPYIPTEDEIAEWEQRRKETDAVPTNEELSAAVMELAENISDIEDAVVELGTLMAQG